MEYLSIYANAKINLALDVCRKREDGYHDLQMIMQTVGLRDTITIRKLFTPQIKLITNLKWLPVDERNLAYKAAKVLFDRFQPEYGAYIEVYKKIPVSAGLAGGSADCAATLIGLTKMFKFPISKAELYEIGKNLGADVPYCMMKGTCLAEGIGEKLTPISPCPDAHIVIAKPSLAIATADVFKQFRQENVEKRPDIAALISFIEKGDMDGISQNLCNVLESVTAKEFPVIEKIKAMMIENGASGALMSGSGPAVFGIFKDKKKAFNAQMALKIKLNIKEVYITNIFNNERSGFGE